MKCHLVTSTIVAWDDHLHAMPSFQDALAGVEVLPIAVESVP